MSYKAEGEILSRLRKRADAGGMVLGIGDDCAIYRPRRGEELVFTTDLLIEDIHFRRATHKAKEIGYKALARGLSDIAAMGATPRFCLFSIAVPVGVSSRYLDGIFDGLLGLAARERCALAGGDLSRSTVLTCDIVVCGSCPTGKALRRSGAKAGDAIYVSGVLGGSALGLELGRGKAWKRHVHPEPRLALGHYLRGKATAAMDLSDGLSLDLQRMGVESGLAAELDCEPLRFPGATLEQALHGGEDYELLFTSNRKSPPVFEGLPLTRIGYMKAGKPGDVRIEGKRLAPQGYDHFRPR